MVAGRGDHEQASPVGADPLDLFTVPRREDVEDQRGGAGLDRDLVPDVGDDGTGAGMDLGRPPRRKLGIVDAEAEPVGKPFEDVGQVPAGAGAEVDDGTFDLVESALAISALIASATGWNSPAPSTRSRASSISAESAVWVPERLPSRLTYPCRAMLAVWPLLQMSEAPFWRRSPPQWGQIRMSMTSESTEAQ